MNRHAHKIIFNKRLGRMDVVSEIVSNQGKGSQTTGYSNGITTTLIKPLVFALMLTLGMAQILPVQAGTIVADSNAPKTEQPTILNTASGATQVNIQTPTAGGVSMNQYQQFDAQSNGTILNNSRTNANTQTAGLIQGNPWLATGTARVIVNQVNSNNPSLLNGNIEVAGNRAEVIIANPAGIQVNGATFINAARTTLSTGKPIIDNGNLTGYQVNQGQISVNGQGLNTQGSDYTDILARSVQINAGIWANQLKVTAGVNAINADNTQVTAQTTSVASGATPQFAIDTSALGGMYAGKIILIGTEQGVGVNNAGQIAASAGHVTVDVTGQLSNSGTINSNGADNTTQITSQSLNNSGTISSQGNTQIQTGLATNSGTLAAGRELKLNASDINNSNGTINGQRVELNANSLNNTNGKIQQTGMQALALHSGSLSNANNGLIGYEPISSGTGTDTGTGTGSTGSTGGGTDTSTPSTATGGGSSTVVQPAPVALADGAINISGAVNNNAGQITANGGIDLTSTTGLENHAKLDLRNLTVKGITLDNSSGTLTVSQAQIQTNSINNTAGQFGSTGDIQLTTDNLTNTQGKLTASGGITAAVQGATLNDQGTFASNGALQLNTGSLNNSQGTLSSVQSDATINSQGMVNNASGQIIAAKGLQLSSTQLDNGSGTIKAQTLSLDTRNNSLNNTKGQISADQTTISSGALNNDAGLLQASQRLNINTNRQSLTNTNSGSTAGILSGGSLRVQSGDLNNGAGYIGGAGSADIQAAQIQNKGQISSQGTLSIAASGLNNHDGSVQSLGDTQINLGSGTLDNNVGLIRSGAHIQINAGTLNNQNTQTTNQGVEGAQVTLGVQTLDNSSGAVRADQALNITSSGSVNNSGGLLSSGGALQIQDPNSSKNLAVTNAGGTIIAALSNTIDAKSITGDGKLLSNQDLSVTVVDDLNNTASIQASRNLSVSSAANIHNAGLIASGDTATVHAQSLDNAASGEISAGTTDISITQNLTNRGLIDGTDTRLSAANTLTNIGTGRIYGSHLSIAVNTLNNVDETVNGSNTAATIAARNQLDIGAQTINNHEHATLFADGVLNIGGSLDANHMATGQAAVLNNASATIESTGNMNLSVTQINNTNEHFASEIQVVKQERVSEVQGFIAGESSPTALNPSAVYTVDPERMQTLPNLANEVNPDYLLNAQHNVVIHNDESNHLITPEGLYGNWNLKDFIRTTSESVVTQTDPGKIISGGDLSLSTGQLLNNNSQVLVGGTLQGDSSNISNAETLGQKVIHDVGTVADFWRNHKKGRDNTGIASNPYDVTHPTQDINISVSAVKEHTQANTGMSVAANSTHSVTDSASGSQSANATVSVQALNTTDPTLIKTAAINTNMPNSSLFTVNPQNAGYFIQTDPRFADYRNWLSSDYMLSALNLDPTNMHKRLGDGYYEQKLIREQVAQLTGRRFLTGQSNDDEQYKALMNAGLTFAKDYNLRPGIALTAEQMAHLTSDIVWLVEQEVTLPDGSKATAWVPRVYVAVKPGDIDGSGSLISANRINLNLSGDLNNGGTISGRTVTQITAQNLNNLGGRISADQLNLNAQNDLNNIGGTIDANTSAVIRAGNNVNMSTTTNTAANNYGSETVVNRVAGLYVGNGANALLADSEQPVNTLLIQAGNNVNLNAAQISNAGTGGSRIEAITGDVNLGTVQQGKQERIYRDARNGHVVNETSAVGTQIAGVGNVSLVAGRDVNTQAADVSSEDGTLAVKAGRDINIATGNSSRETVADSYEHKKGFLSSKSTTIHNESQSQNSIASNLTGSSVVLDAERNANIIGSNVVSDNLTQVNAGNDVNILAASNSETTSNFKEVNKSGLMGTGGFGFMIGKKQDATDTDNTNVTQTGSQVGSLGGKVNIVAGNHYQQTGSSVTSGLSVDGQFVAGDAVNIVAKSVDITAGQNTYATDTVHQTKQSGLTVAVNVPVVNAVMAVADAAKTIGQSKNDRVNAMAAANTAYSAVKAADALKGLQNVQSAKDLNVSVSITVGSSQSKQETHSKGTEAVSSTVAGKEVNIIATGGGKDSNIHVQGSNVSGTDATRLIADNNVILESAQNTSEEHSSNKSSGWNAGVVVGTQGIGITAGGNYGKGKGEGSGITQVNSHVGSTTGNTLISAGGDTTLAGAQVLGKRVELDTNNLTIESRQDTNQYHSKQKDMSAQFTVGAGASVSGSYSQNKTNADYASVNEQSGILAGDGGYNVNVKNHTDLKGGIITSTQAAEDAGRNRFSTGTLSASDIQNHADYSASGFGIGGGFSVGGSGTQDKDSKLQNFGSNGQVSNVNKSIGYGSDSGHDRSVTTSGINTSNISITDVAGQNASGISVEQIKAQVKTDTTTDTVQTNSGAIANNFDKDAVQKEIGLQVSVTQQFDNTRQGVKAEINQQVDKQQQAVKEAKAALELNPYDPVATQKLADANAAIENWQQGGVLVDMIAGGLSGPTSTGAAGTMANAAAPALQFAVGQYFKGQQAEGSTAHIVAHTVLAAAVAAAGGNDALTAGLSAGGAEALAPVVSNWLYGKDAKELTADEKATVSNIVSLGAAGLTAGAGGTGADMVSSSQLASSAVEDNSLVYAPFPLLTPNQVKADKLASDIADGRVPYTKLMFDQLYLLNTNKNLEVPINITNWTINQTSEFRSPQNPIKGCPACLVASAQIPYTDSNRWAVNGSLGLIKYPTGEIKVTDNYSFEMHPVTSIKAVIRNDETILGDPTFPFNPYQKGTPFNFKFYGVPNIQRAK